MSFRSGWITQSAASYNLSEFEFEFLKYMSKSMPIVKSIKDEERVMTRFGLPKRWILSYVNVVSLIFFPILASQKCVRSLILSKILILHCNKNHHLNLKKCYFIFLVAWCAYKSNVISYTKLITFFPYSRHFF